MRHLAQMTELDRMGIREHARYPVSAPGAGGVSPYQAPLPKVRADGIVAEQFERYVRERKENEWLDRVTAAITSDEEDAPAAARGAPGDPAARGERGSDSGSEVSSVDLAAGARPGRPPRARASTPPRSAPGGDVRRSASKVPAWVDVVTGRPVAADGAEVEPWRLARVHTHGDAPRPGAGGRPRVPPHEGYAFYKYFGFAGQGAKTAWAHNPKYGPVEGKYYGPGRRAGPKRMELTRSTAYLRQSKEDIRREDRRARSITVDVVTGAETEPWAEPGGKGPAGEPGKESWRKASVVTHRAPLSYQGRRPFHQNYQREWRPPSPVLFGAGTVAWALSRAASRRRGAACPPGQKCPPAGAAGAVPPPEPPPPRKTQTTSTTASRGRGPRRPTPSTPS